MGCRGLGGRWLLLLLLLRFFRGGWLGVSWGLFYDEMDDFVVMLLLWK